MNEISIRFINVYEALLKEGKVSGLKDFALKVGISTSMMTEITKGRSNAGVTAIHNTVIVFGLNAQWLFTGKGIMFIDGISNSLHTESNTDINSESLIYYKMFKEKDSEVGILREEIGRLKQELESLKKIIENFTFLEEKGRTNTVECATASSD